MNDKIATLSKNGREQLVFTLADYKGRRFIDIRTHINADNGGDAIPTRKGVTIPLALYPQFKAAIADVEATILSEGLLDNEDLET